MARCVTSGCPYVCSRGLLPSVTGRSSSRYDAAINEGWLESVGRQGFVRSEIRDEAITFQKYLSTKALEDLTDTQRHTVLESNFFLKEKRDGTIKERTVADGNKQRRYISKEDASLPTVDS